MGIGKLESLWNVPLEGDTLVVALGSRSYPARHPDSNRKSVQTVEWPGAVLSVCSQAEP